MDYRKVNACTYLDIYPLPRLEESLVVLGQAQYFSTLDLASGYWQVPVREQNRVLVKNRKCERGSKLKPK